MVRLQQKVVLRSLASPRRQQLIRIASRQIFGHLGSEDSPFGCHKILGHRSPRYIFHSHLVHGQLLAYHYPHLDHRWLTGRIGGRMLRKQQQAEDEQEMQFAKLSEEELAEEAEEAKAKQARRKAAAEKRKNDRKKDMV